MSRPPPYTPLFPPTPLSRPAPERAQARRKAAHRSRELTVGEPPRRALFALEHERRPGRIVAQRRGHVVHATADPPRGPGNAARPVEHPLVGRLPHEAEIAVDGMPEAIEVFDRPAGQRGEVAVTVLLGETAQPTAG